jgi:hypothetical protein
LTAGEREDLGNREAMPGKRQGRKAGDRKGLKRLIKSGN